VLAAGGTIAQETRDYDGVKGVSQSLRSKEMAHDYRYFPDPDLMPVRVDEAWRERLRAELPERPFDKQRRFMADHALPYTLTAVLITDRRLCDYFEEAVRLGGPAQAVANWMVNDLQRELGAARISLAETKVGPAHLAALVKLIEAGTLRMPAAREVFTLMFQSGEPPEVVAARAGLLAEPTDEAEMEQWCRDAIAGNDKARAEFVAGKESALNALKGPVMKASRGQADPKKVDATLRRLLAG
jgi:aspartyl-tRNA(Asn)/glutamyl-tRNA(Gln) amidotransferase subunit B